MSMFDLWTPSPFVNLVIDVRGYSDLVWRKKWLLGQVSEEPRSAITETV